MSTTTATSGTILENTVIIRIDSFCRYGVIFVLMLISAIACGVEPELKTYTDPAGKPMAYYLAQPKAVKAGDRVPLVVFMHGGGPRGLRGGGKGPDRDGTKFFTDDAYQAKYPSYVVSPQCPSGRCWTGHGFGDGAHTMDSQPTEAIRMAFELLPKLMTEFPAIDPNRIYLVGASNGGYATWEMIARHVELFAAAVPCSGAGDIAQAPKLIHLPIWTEHGSADTIVPIKGTRAMVAAIKAAGGTAIQFLEHSEGHGQWGKLLGDEKFQTWLNEQRRAPAAAAKP